MTMLRILPILLAVLLCQAHPCQNNSQIKYDLAEESEIVGYHSICSEFTDRTCCSMNNLDNVRRKYSSRQFRISKYFANKQDTSIPCRHVLSTLMCSVCDGDIVIHQLIQGTRRKTSICRSYCNQVYEVCKDDYFITEGNRLRVCIQSDPVCSTLKTIVNGGAERACELLGYETQKAAQQEFINIGTSKCWDGTASSLKLGKARKKVNTQSSRHPKKRWIQWDTKTLVVILAAIALATVGIIKFIRR